MNGKPNGGKTMKPVWTNPNTEPVPQAVIDSIIKAYGHDPELCVNAFRCLRYDALNGCFCLSHAGMYIGIECSDGYMHT
jgi:hypothetical protein